VNAVATDAVRRPATSLTDRLVAAIPLTGLYVWLCTVYCVEAWKHLTPWLFTDELEMTQISRSIAATGHPARRGQPYSFHSLYPVLTAPMWLIDHVPTAYAGIKYLDVLAMTSVVFPTYFLARLVVGHRWALFAAAAAGTIPSLAYSSWLVEETIAYPYAALCFLLVVKALMTRARWWAAGAAVASIVAPAVRGELIVIPIIGVLASLFAYWGSNRARARRTSWTTGDWLGFFVVVAGIIIAASGYLTWHVDQWQKVTSYNWTKKRIFVYGDWAAGALAIGIGVVPLVAGIAALFRAPGERASRNVRMFRCVAAASIISFGVYTAMKAAYLTMSFETRVEERNLIYIAPLLFVGTALVLERRRVNFLALAGAAAFAFYLVIGTPFKMDVGLYSDALGLALFQQANRYFEWTSTTAHWVVLAAFAVGLILLVAASLRRIPHWLAIGCTAILAVGLLAWNVTGEISAAAGTTSISRDIAPLLGKPFTWVDDVAHGKPTMYFAQGVVDQQPEWLLEFWNRSITTVTSLDSSVRGPGPSGAPNVTRTGQLYWTHDPSQPGKIFDYAVEDWPCVDFAGAFAKQHAYRLGTNVKEWRLVRLTKPNRLLAQCSGIYPDGWSGPDDSSYFRFSGTKAGWLRISLSRQNWRSTPVTIQLGPIGVQHHSPVLLHVTKELRFTLQSKQPLVKWLRVPASAYAVRVVVEQKFVPRDLNPGIGDPRTLGALVDYRFFRNRR
jgi:uncharacterized membrane protein YidH (DUF202 family)